MAYTPDEVKLLIDAAESLNEKLKNVQFYFDADSLKGFNEEAAGLKTPLERPMIKITA